ncbi:hypothetical protein LCC91_09100 [Tepidimonas taiwanensis]|uniref:Uncharacterized protein n=1 Tax=Tepidimonas taiwanensis TaxID=307486 RepID=A0A554X5V6_9BURK|nr:hypothetical protein [Tepidimonas taiwanensis]MCX7693711.1 hypothetical protein [Tepidimonas taiwanensis]MDM7463904.1 hypothetical protein [Tepidimonas taiwanensis]TSE31218.1 hypothetical protein Ttaiw_01595 [Tepidimonas taiwanensis]UBQ04719.1 hypothetical protein LCC91_09100 [Tepidimonas taiwanensis]
MSPTDSRPPTRERRRDDTLRQIFEDAYRLCVPYLDPRNGIRGVPMVHQAIVMLREHYPQLDMLQVYVLVQALQRAHTARQRATASVSH